MNSRFSKKQNTSEKLKVKQYGAAALICILIAVIMTVICLVWGSAMLGCGTGPKTFVREKNGLVSRIQFIGYFRGGGYEAIICYLCPIYAIQYGILGLPGHICQGESFQRMKKDWGVIQYGMEAVDDAMVERINRKFDDILIFLADGVMPEWQKIDSLETYFARERQDYLKATETGPKDPRTGRAMWDLGAGGKEDPWRADDYLFGVWDLLNGKKTEGYVHLEKCVRRNTDYLVQNIININGIRQRLKGIEAFEQETGISLPDSYRNIQYRIRTTSNSLCDKIFRYNQKT